MKTELAVLASTMFAGLLCACATQPTSAPSGPPLAEVSGTPPTSAPADASPRLPRLVPDEQAPVAPDLRRLARTFVSYAVGASLTLPHRQSLSMSIGGQPAASVDDIGAALSDRETWRTCPADWDSYGASSCPVDLLGPIDSAVVNDAVLVYSAAYDDVTCAPTRSGPPPSGRLVVLRPSEQWRTCANDFALVLVADEQGRLRHVDLTLAAP